MRCLPRSEEKPAEHRPTGNLKGKPQAGSLNMAWMAEEEAGSSSSCTLTGGKMTIAAAKINGLTANAAGRTSAETERWPGSQLDGQIKQGAR